MIQGTSHSDNNWWASGYSAYGDQYYSGHMDDRTMNGSFHPKAFQHGHAKPHRKSMGDGNQHQMPKTSSGSKGSKIREHKGVEYRHNKVPRANDF